MKSLYVSENGHDANTGSKELPFATIDKARLEVRKFKKTNHNEDITVFIRGGSYVLDKTVIFELEDSGNSSQRITYEAFQSEVPVFSSGKKITNWHQLNDDALVNEKAKGNIWVADVKKLLKSKARFYTLYDGEKRLSRARSNGFAPVNEGESFKGAEEEHKTLHFPEDAPIKNWENLEDIEVVLRAAAAWQMSILPLESVDIEMGKAIVSTPSLYKICKTMWIRDNSETVWVENALEFIDGPGQWALNTLEGKLYLWPNGDVPGDNICVPMLKEYFIVEGEIDFEGSVDVPVREITFKGLTFINGERDTWDEGYRGYELQHSWDFLDRDNALLRFRGAENCLVEGCRFLESGGGAIRMDLHCKTNKIAGNLIEHMGGTGILLAGYGPGTKDVNGNNQVISNCVNNVGEIYWHSLGIFVWQSGENIIANNLIHSLPYGGIGVTGRIGFDPGQECHNTIRWGEIRCNPKDYHEQLKYLHSWNNVIKNNEIYDVVNVLGDGNGIYVSGAGLGNKVLNNYVHHNLSPHFGEGIRCDDHQDGTTIESNIVYMTGGLGTGITSKGVNHIINNIIACPTVKTERGMISLELGPVKGSKIERNILYATRSDHNAIFQDRLYGDGVIPRLHHTSSDKNLYYNSDVSGWGSMVIESERKNGVEIESIEADPMFIDIFTGDFRLASNSPALDLGFKPIDMSKIGLMDSFPYDCE